MISIIICTYNRDKYIYNVLSSIAANDFPIDRYEIVLVNNNSTDNTESEFQRFKNDFPYVVTQYAFESNQGLSFARNRGVQEAKGDVVVFVDDDALVNREYIGSYYSLFENNQNIAAAGGPIIPKYDTSEPKWFSHFTKRLVTGYLYFGDKVKKFPSDNYPGGGNAAYRREVFEKVGLYNTELGRKGNSLVGAEEKDIFDKMAQCGMSVFYIPTAVLYHIIPESKLTEEYFNRLTLGIGKSERIRTLGVSKGNYYKRLLKEAIKWGATIILCAYHTITLHPQRGIKLIQFRWNVTRGLLL